MLSTRTILATSLKTARRFLPICTRAQLPTVHILNDRFKVKRRYATGPIPTVILEGGSRRVEREDAPIDPRIYFLGVGSIGKLIAYAFRDIPKPPPVTLIFPSRSKCEDFLANDGTLEYVRKGLSDLRPGYNAEYTPVANPELDTRPMIDNLIVGTKSPFTSTALLSVKHRLRPQSTIVLLQNGMGLVEELNEKVFPDVETRPHYVIGIVTHAAINKSLFTVDHTGIGNIALSAFPKTPFEGVSEPRSHAALLAPSTRHLLRTFTRTPLLGGITLEPRDLLLVQLEKLAGNCVINPLTAILGCLNGELIRSSAAKLVRLLLAEISLVIRSLPEIQAIPGIENRFSPATLEYNVRKLITSTGRNKSSMLQDILRGRRTEIDYLNGYIFRRGEELGIRSMVNFTMKTMVVTRSLMAREEFGKLVEADDHVADLDKIP